MCLISNSDHNVIVLMPNTLNHPNVHHQSSPTTALYNFKKGNYSTINDYLSQVDWNALFQFCPNFDFCWKEFRFRTDLAIEMFVPKLTLSDRKHKSKYPYFINKLLKTKSKLWRNWRTDTSDANRNLYYRFAKRCTTSITDYFRSKELELLKSGKIGQFFKYVNTKMHMKYGVSEVASLMVA